MAMYEEQGETTPEPEGDGFRQELKSLLNKHSREGGSNTPDHILANYLVACLAAFDTATHQREEWYGIRLVPGQLSGPVQHIREGVTEGPVIND